MKNGLALDQERALRDLDIRTALRSRLVALHERDDHARIIDEVEVCLHRARVDIAAINGRFEGYEIKSDHDSLSRLARQGEIYNLVFDRITVVSGERHLAGVQEQTPSWWGVMRATRDRAGAVKLTHVRPARANPGVDAFSVASLLWRPEALSALEIRGLADGVRSKSAPMLWQRLADELGLRELRALTREAMCAREGWRSAESPGLGGEPTRPSARSRGSQRVLPPHRRR